MAEASDAAAAMREQGLGVVGTFQVPSDWSTLRRILVHPRALLQGRPFGAVRFQSREFGGVVRDTLARGADLVHLDTIDIAPHLPTRSDIPVVCNYHDVESPALKRRAQNERSRALRWYLRRQVRAYRRFERQLAESVELNVVCSGRERGHLLQIAPAARVEVVPNGVDTDYFQPTPDEPDEHTIVFVGGLDMFPNHDGLKFFLDSVWPSIRARRPRCTLLVVGNLPPQRKAELSGHAGVRFEGRVEDVRPSMTRAACVIVPLRLGGATRLKIVHAWGMAKAVVSTAVGCEGLDARDGENILIRDEPEAFAAGVLEVLEDSALRDRLGREGRETACTTYSWTVIGRQARALYAALLGDSPNVV